jgi:hypothetical protein
VETKILDEAIAQWTDMHSRLAASLPELRESRRQIGLSEEQTEWLDAHLDAKLEILKSAQLGLVSVKTAAENLGDPPLATIIADLTGTFALQSYSIIAERVISGRSGRSAEAVDSEALERCAELAKVLVAQIRAECSQAVEAAERKGQMVVDTHKGTTFNSSPIFTDPRVPAELREIHEALQESATSLRRLHERVSAIEQLTPTLVRSSLHLIESTVVLHLEDAAFRRFDRIARRYWAYRLLAEYSPQLIGIGVEVWSTTPGLSSAIGLLFSFMSKELTEFRLASAERGDIALERSLTLEVLPFFLLPHGACVLANVSFLNARLLQG